MKRIETSLPGSEGSHGTFGLSDAPGSRSFAAVMIVESDNIFTTVLRARDRLNPLFRLFRLEEALE